MTDRLETRLQESGEREVGLADRRVDYERTACR
jgi:hypothetical protein